MVQIILYYKKVIFYLQKHFYYLQNAMKIKNTTQLIFDLNISAFFMLFSMTIISFIIPSGFNAKFLLLGSKFISLVFVSLTIISLIFWLFYKNFKLKRKFSLPELKDLFLVALPLSPVIDYGLINIEYLNLNGWIYLIGTTSIFILFSVSFYQYFSVTLLHLKCSCFLG